MTVCAVCQLSDGLVINIIVAETTDEPPLDCQLVVTPTDTGSYANIGFHWNGTDFIDPNPVMEE